MKKIDILNYITDFRKLPNDVKTFDQIKQHLKTEQEAALVAMLEEMKQLRTLREVEKDGQRAFQVVAK